MAVTLSLRKTPLPHRQWVMLEEFYHSLWALDFVIQFLSSFWNKEDGSPSISGKGSLEIPRCSHRPFFFIVVHPPRFKVLKWVRFSYCRDCYYGYCYCFLLMPINFWYKECSMMEYPHTGNCVTSYPITYCVAIDSQMVFESHQLLFDKLIERLPASARLLARIKVAIVTLQWEYDCIQSFSWSMKLSWERSQDLEIMWPQELCRKPCSLQKWSL